ncbi:MAG: hypothetical protein P8L85_05520 [Rubripirellula sp.]|nr:hypothetical protein [Rubripirellula sp.]
MMVDSIPPLHKAALCPFIILTISLGLLTNVLLATPPKNHAETTAEGNDKQIASKPTQIDKESEAKANQLVAIHLPELKNILRRLRESEPQEYAKAIHDLARSARKLEIAKNRTNGGFEVELQLLKSQTEVNLLTARLRVRDSSRDRKQLRSALTRFQTAQFERTKYEVQTLRDRLERTQKLLASAEQRLESKQQLSTEQFEKNYLRLIRKAGREPIGQNDAKPNRKPGQVESKTAPNKSPTPESPGKNLP